MQTRILFFLLILGPVTQAQTFSEKITKELSFEKPSANNALILANINGSVKVVGYAGDLVLLEATKSIEAKTAPRLQKGKAEIQIGIIDRADTLIVYVRDGCNQFSKNEKRSGHSGEEGWSYHSQIQHDCQLGYDFTMDFTVKVPSALHLLVSTVNKGDVVVENVTGMVKARNINGGIRLVKLKNEADAHTINGDVDIEYTENPGKDCKFYTLNGNINALFQPSLSANLAFESFNGSLFTNLTRMESLPQEVQETKHGNGIQYKISGNRYQVGNGGPLLNFETFNGNVYLKEKQTK